MAKRFTDNGKWNKPFLRTMKAPYKLLWLFILDECDHAGIWQVDFPVAQLKIGEKLKHEEAILAFGNKIIPFDNGEKWLILDFINFQYGELNPANRVHESVINILKKYKLLNNENEIIKPLTSTLQGAKDKDKDKDEVKVKEIIPQIDEFLNYCKTLLPNTYNDFEFPLKAKYESWVLNGWKDGNNMLIKNWKNKIQSTIPYLKPFKPINGTKVAPTQMDTPMLKPITK